jgi:voltage-gated potassium channel
MATFFLKKSDSTGYRSQTIEDIKTRLDNFDDLSIEDINNIHNVLIALKK